MKTAFFFVTVTLSVLLMLNRSLVAQKPAVTDVDICIYGGTSAGVIAAYTAKLQGKSVLLIEPGKHLGGMSSGGLGQTDIGNKFAITGIARDFYRRIGMHYGKFEQWTFEPKVSEALFQEYIKRGKVNVLNASRITSVKKSGTTIIEINLQDSFTPATGSAKTVRAKMFMDCSYEGDLMAMAGVGYAVGREDNKDYNETINGFQIMDGHQFPEDVDPYKVKGDSASGLLWGINKANVQPAGTGDKKVQAYNFRITLTNVPANIVPITKPANYDAEKYALLIRQMEKRPWKGLNDGFIWSLMPNGKTDINNRNGFSTDMIGMNWEYPEADYKTRERIWNEHVDYTKGLLYFVGNDPQVSQLVRDEMKKWGYPKDEYTDNSNWSHQLYVREARRMIGKLVMTQHHCQGRELVTDGVGMAAYTMDSHNCDRQAINGQVRNEGNVEIGGFGPYPISYQAIIPKQEEVTNLLVPVCLSATHIAYGSIRMEPVFMVLGQSAAIAASMAIDNKIAIQEIDVTKLQAILKSNPLGNGSTPEILVDNEDKETTKVSGTWATAKSGGYGPTYLLSEPGTAVAQSVQFSPDIKKAGKYNVFVYMPKLPTASTKTQVEVFDGKKQKMIAINKADIIVVGQTSGEWAPLGTYALERGNKAFVKISNKEADGVVVADAVIFVPVP